MVILCTNLNIFIQAAYNEVNKDANYNAALKQAQYYLGSTGQR